MDNMNMNVKELRDLHIQSDSGSSSCDDGEASDQNKHILKKFAPALYSYNELKNNLVLIGPGNKSSEVSAKSDSEIYELISNELKEFAKFSCKICDKKGLPPGNCKDHFITKKHQKKVESYTKQRFQWFKDDQPLLSDSQINELITKELEESSKLTCELCKISHLTPANYGGHFYGKKHRNSAEIYTKQRYEWFKNQDSSTQILGDTSFNQDFLSDFKIYEIISKELKDVSKNLSCEICGIKNLPPANSKTHFNGKRHKQNAEIYTKERFEWFKEHNNNFQVLGVNNVTSSNPVLLSDPKIQKGNAKELGNISKKIICEICGMKDIPPSNSNAHFNGKRHQKNAKKYAKKQFDWFKNLFNNVLGDNNVSYSNEVPLPDSKIYELISNELKELSKFSCKICGKKDLPRANCYNHFIGGRHQENVEIYTNQRFEWFKNDQPMLSDSEIYELISKKLEESFKLSCEICNIGLLPPANCKTHFRGKRHQNNAQVFREERFKWLKAFTSNAQDLSDSVRGNNVTSPHQSLLSASNDLTLASTSKEGSSNSTTNNSLKPINISKPVPKTYADSLKSTPVLSVVQNTVEPQSSFKNETGAPSYDKNVEVIVKPISSTQELPESSEEGVQREYNENQSFAHARSYNNYNSCNNIIEVSNENPKTCCGFLDFFTCCF